MDSKEITFKANPNGYEVLTPRGKIGDIKTLKSDLYSLHLEYQGKTLEKDSININDAVRASINFMKYD